MQTTNINLWIALWAGVASFVSPCVLPLVPSYLAFVTGVSLGDLQDQEQRRRLWLRTFLHSLMFVAGFSLVFILVYGGLAQAFGFVFARYSTVIYRVGGVLVILLGLFFAGVLPLKFLDVEKRLQLDRKPAGYLGSMLVGIVFAAGWTPCIGAILGSVITIASTSKTSGFVLLTAYSIGMGVPFLLTSLALNTFFGTYARLKRHFRVITLVSGLLLAAIGVLMVTGLFQRLSSLATRLPFAQ